jgi:CzcA family heavy metal efflux pump
MTRRAAGPQAALVRFAVSFPGVVIALACVLLGYGIYVLGQTKYDVFPEFAPPQVSIQTEAPGLAPEQVETLVTQPLENQLNGVPGLRSLLSTSIPGLSVITVTFESSSDVYRDRQIVAERIAAAAVRLPRGVEAPSLTPLTSSASTVLVLGLASRQNSLLELRTIADWTLRPRLLAVPGVAKVAIFGVEGRSLQVRVHPERLVRLGLGLDDVLSATQRATGMRGTGFVDTVNQRIQLRAEGQSLTPEDLASTVLASHAGGSVLLGHVADVVAASGSPISGALINGEQGVIVNVSEQYGANTVEVTNAVEAALRDLRPGLQRAGIELHTGLFRPATFIDVATDNVRSSLLLGGVLVVLVLLLFLFDLRSAAISCAAIPLSLLAAVIVLQRLGVTLNTMTLGGLAIAIGVVVDDAVIDVENIVRRLRENRRLPNPSPPARVVLDGCLEVRSAVVYGTFAVVLVVLPILALPDIAGRLFAPLAFAYALAVLASLIVALTVTPALALVLLTGGHVRPTAPPVLRWTRAAYESLLRRIVRAPRRVVAGALLITGAACAVLPFLTSSFIPELKEGHFTVHMAAVPGTSIDESLRLGVLVTRALANVPAVKSVAQRVGRAELGEDTNGTHYSEFEVDLKALDGDQAETIRADIRRALIGIPGVNFAVNTFLTERIDETLSGYNAPIVVNVFGSDLEVLDAKSQEIFRVLRNIPGATDTVVRSPPGMQQLAIRLRPADLQRWGFDAVDVLDALRVAYSGETVAQVYDGNRVFPVTVTLAPQERASIAQVGELPLRSRSGQYVRLAQLADIEQGAGRYEVSHQGARRVQTVTTDVAGREVGAFVDEARARIAATVTLPAGYYIEFAGAAEAQSTSERDLLLNSTIALTGIVLLLAVATRRASNLLLMAASVPFAFVGALLAVFAVGGSLSLGSMVGFVALFGITLRNAILMLAHYEQLVRREGIEWGEAAAVRGAADRLAPILMTSLVTALGVLPLAVGMNDAGREIEGPMAVVIVGGLLTSMVLNLLLLPTLALRYGRFS